MTDRLKTCERWQNRKTKRGTSALRVHNAQNRDKRAEEVFCLAPKRAVTHGLSVNYTCVTAVIDRLGLGLGYIGINAKVQPYRKGGCTLNFFPRRLKFGIYTN